MRAHLVAFATTFLVGAAASVHADCKPTAVPHGDPILVQDVSERLAASGIATTVIADCPVVRVQVETRGQQVHLRVTDAYQRLGERDVQDVATAAAIIESWTLQEVEIGSMPEEPVRAEAPAPAVIATSPVVTTGLAVSARSTVTEQATTWIGGSISGCKRVGWSCLGATLRANGDTEATGTTVGGDHHLFELDALAVAEVPRRLGGFTFSPGVDIGYAWQRITSEHLDAHMMPFTVAESSHALLVGAHVRVARPIAARWALFGELSGDGAVARTGITTGPTTSFGLSLGARIEVP